MTDDELQALKQRAADFNSTDVWADVRDLLAEVDRLRAIAADDDRCMGRVFSIQCERQAGHEGPHRVQLADTLETPKAG